MSESMWEGADNIHPEILADYEAGLEAEAHSTPRRQRRWRVTISVGWSLERDLSAHLYRFRGMCRFLCIDMESMSV